MQVLGKRGDCQTGKEKVLDKRVFQGEWHLLLRLADRSLIWKLESEIEDSNLRRQAHLLFGPSHSYRVLKKPALEEQQRPESQTPSKFIDQQRNLIKSSQENNEYRVNSEVKLKKQSLVFIDSVYQAKTERMRIKRNYYSLKQEQETIDLEDHANKPQNTIDILEELIQKSQRSLKVLNRFKKQEGEEEDEEEGEEDQESEFSDDSIESFQKWKVQGRQFEQRSHDEQLSPDSNETLESNLRGEGSLIQSEEQSCKLSHQE